jgi:hypothetical protein
LTRLDISKNKLFDDGGAPAGKALGDMLAVNSTLQELDISGSAAYNNSKGGPSFAQALSVGISGNGAMTSLSLADNMLCGINKYGNGTYDASGKWPLALLVTAAAVTHVQPCIGIIALANAIPDMGALASLDLTKNGIGAGPMASISRVLKRRAIQHQRACACLVGHELTTKDVRALLVATYNLNPRCWLLAIRKEQLCKDIVHDIATWL